MSIKNLYIAIFIFIASFLIMGCSTEEKVSDDSGSYGSQTLDPNQPTGPQIQVGCQIVKKDNFDPIIDPPELEAHRHIFYGNTSINPDSDAQSLESNLSTSCNEPVDTSSYWHPVLIDGAATDRLQEPSHITVYFLGPGDQTQIQNIPAGLQLIGNVSTGDTATRDIGVTYRCGEDPAQSNPPYGCDRDVRLTIDFPNCWDQKSVNWEDGSHMVYRTNSCPTNYPYRIPSITIRIRYPNPDNNWQSPTYVSSGANEWKRAEDFMHGDVFFASQLPEFDTYIQDCIRDVADDETRPDKCNPG